MTTRWSQRMPGTDEWQSRRIKENEYKKDENKQDEKEDSNDDKDDDKKEGGAGECQGLTGGLTIRDPMLSWLRQDWKTILLSNSCVVCIRVRCSRPPWLTIQYKSPKSWSWNIQGDFWSILTNVDLCPSEDSSPARLFITPALGAGGTRLLYAKAFVKNSRQQFWGICKYIKSPEDGQRILEICDPLTRLIKWSKM